MIYLSVWIWLKEDEMKREDRKPNTVSNIFFSILKSFVSYLFFFFK